VLGEGALHRDPLHRAPSERDDGCRTAHLSGEGVEGGDDEALLSAAELLLALPLKELLDRLAELTLEQIVRVDHAEAETVRKGFRRPGLPRPHEADEDERVVSG
jgi:hypothetical protein